MTAQEPERSPAGPLERSPAPPPPLQRRPQPPPPVPWSGAPAHSGLSDWRYPVAFVSGIAFAMAAWAVARAFGDASVSLLVDQAAGLIGLAFAFSLFTGVNLGLPASIRSIDGSDGSLVNRGAALRLLLFSVAVLFVGPVISGLLP
ncbi:MAG: hypothetical protein WC709_11060 [Thermoleophilia bacterium]